MKYQGIPIICHLLGKQDVFVSDEQLGDGETVATDTNSPVDVLVEKATGIINSTTYITSLHLYPIYLYIIISIYIYHYIYIYISIIISISLNVYLVLHMVIMTYLLTSFSWSAPELGPLRQSISYQMDYASEVSPVQKVIQLMPARRVSIAAGIRE